MLLSIARVRNFSDPISQECKIQRREGKIWMMDVSIGLGAGKILAILEIDANHHILNGGAPTLKNVKCVAVSVAVSWTGATMADFLKKVMNQVGIPDAFLKDGGTDLAKCVKILNELDYDITAIDDVSHVVANLFKKKYSNNPMFEIFLTACGKASKKMKQTFLAFLVPPKVSTKARFMNLHKLVTWAKQLLDHSSRGRAKKGSAIAKLRKSLDQIPKCRAFIEDFLREASPVLKCQQILKKKGLTQNSYVECQKLIETISQQSSVRTGFEDWLKKHLLIAEKLCLDKAGLPISTDIIESLFGTLKQHGTGAIKDAYRMALRIPAMCGNLTREDATMAMKISTKDMKEILDSIPSLTKQRRQILPNPGSLNEIKMDEIKQPFELIPGSKTRSKNQINQSISESYDKVGGSAACL